MKTKPTCRDHNKLIQILCKECNSLLCVGCIEEHNSKECRGMIDLSTYASKELLPKYKDQIEFFDDNKDGIEESVKSFLDSSTNIHNGLIQLKEKLEYLLGHINSGIKTLSQYIPLTSSTAYKVKELLINEYMEVRNAVMKEDMWCIIQKLRVKDPTSVIGLGLNEKVLVESIVETIAHLIEMKELPTLTEQLDELEKVYKRFSDQCGPKITGKEIYGICKQQSNYKKLFKYDILTKKITPIIEVPEKCTVTQLGRHIYVSGGCNPLTNKLSELLEDTKTSIQSLNPKTPMKVPKYFHTIEPICNISFITIGGYDNYAAITTCEVYSVSGNNWGAAPSLNVARYKAASCLMANRYVYVIGGCKSKGVVERLDFSLMNNWSLIELITCEMNFTAYPAAFSLSEDEILVLNGDNCSKIGVLNIKEHTIKKSELTSKSDEYSYNPVCRIGSDVLIIGDRNGHIHMYIGEKKSFHDVEYSTTLK